MGIARERVGEWIVNTGKGGCPVPSGTKIEVKYIGDECTYDCNSPESLRWEYIGGSADIGSYRLAASEYAVKVDDLRSVSDVNPKQIHGQSNLPLSLFSPLATAYGSIGKLNGKLKYGLSNFVATPVIASIYVDATKRHLDKWMSGEELDSNDGVPHFSAILANIDILICARAAGTLIDDRPLSKGYFEEIEKLTPIVKALHELHKDKKPHHYLLSEQDGTV